MRALRAWGQKNITRVMQVLSSVVSRRLPPTLDRLTSEPSRLFLVLWALWASWASWVWAPWIQAWLGGIFLDWPHLLQVMHILRPVRITSCFWSCHHEGIKKLGFQRRTKSDFFLLFLPHLAPCIHTTPSLSTRLGSPPSSPPPLGLLDE